jgi:hypothetical protein
VAERDDLIFREAEGIRYICVTESGSTEFGDFLFLILGHEVSPPLSTADEEAI